MDLGLTHDTTLCLAASSGLGLACAESLASEGADVALCGRTPEHVENARERVEAAGSGDVLAVRADITDAGEMRALVAETVETLGGLDHLVTSAGGPPSGSFLATEDADWRDAFELLVMSTVHTLRAAQPHLSDGGGTWTAITSRTVREVADALVLSNAVRRAVIGLVKTTARELSPEIRSNAVLPGALETSRIEDLINAGVERGEYADYDAGYADWAADVPLDRIGDPRELGDVVAMLASDRASYVNGATLAIDGGSMRSA